MRSIRAVVGMLGVAALLAVVITGTAAASSAKACDGPSHHVPSDLAGCSAPAASTTAVARDRSATLAAARAAVIRQVCQLLKHHGLSNLKLCEVPTYLQHVSAGILPYNPASGDSPDVVFNNSIYCNPGDTATGELRNVQIASGYTYSSMQSPDNPNSIYVKVVRPPTDFDYMKHPTDADLISFTFDFVCQDTALPAHT
jgi:hypothetical protein